MRPTVFQKAEIRDENDVIVQQGTYGKGSALSNSTNDGWVDYVMNNLEFLYGLAKDEVVPVSALPASGDMNKTYLLTTTGVCYRWDGTAWVEISSSEAVGRAETAASLAEQWATKTDGTVADNEYSAKYYANAAQQSADDAQDVADDMATHLAQIDQNTGGVSANSKRIGNIEKLLQGNLYDYDTDDDTAYIKAVPAGAMPYAGLEKVGGRTVAWNQLVQNGNFADSTGWNVTTTGATISVADNIATITYNSGTLQDYHPALKSSDITCYKNHKYLISFDIKFSKQGQANFASPIANYQSFVVEANTWHKERSIKEKTTNTSTGYFYIGDSKAPDNFDVGDTIQYKNIMIIDLTLLFGAGNEPSTVEEFEAMFPALFYPYSAPTLLSAGVAEVESKGKNLVNITPFTTTMTNDYYIDKKVGYELKPNIFYAFSFNIDVGSFSEAYYATVGIGTASAYKHDIVNATRETGNRTISLVASVTQSDIDTYGNVLWVRFFRVISPATTTYTVSNIQFEESSTATPYSPYFSITTPIPAEVQALEGYGWSAGSVYNYIDFERKVFVQRVGRVTVTDGTGFILHNTGTTTTVFRKSNVVNNTPVESNEVSNYLIRDAYAFSPSTARVNTFILGGSRGLYLQFLTTEVGTTEELNTRLTNQPLTIYYELSTPIETDISAYLTDDNLIEVEAGGSLTFPNQNGTDYQIHVPSEETYMIDLQSAIGG